MEVFVTRQPIFDREDRIAGYELLYRSHQASVRAPERVLPEMSSRVIVDAFLGIGLDRVTDGHPAYINCPRELLLSGTLELLNPGKVVLEVLETVEPDEDVVAACKHLARKGYRLALDDFVFAERWQPLLRIAEVIKIDVLAHTVEELEQVVEQLHGYNAYLLAEKVENEPVRALCMRLGFDLFQGYHFSHPEVLTRRDLSVEQIQLLRLLNQLRDPGASDAELEDAFRLDVSLSYKLLRIANSAPVASSGIRSLGHAIRLLGRDPIYRWILLLLTSTVEVRRDVDAVFIESVLIRARFSELIAKATGNAALAGSLFLVGLLSRLDVLLGVELNELLSHLVLTPAVREAVVDGTGPLAPTIALATAYEEGRWDVVEASAARLGVRSADLPDLYVEALTWSRRPLKTA